MSKAKEGEEGPESQAPSRSLLGKTLRSAEKWEDLRLNLGFPVIGQGVKEFVCPAEIGSG